MNASENHTSFKLVFAGVGGQGVLTLAQFVGEAAFLSGHHVTMSQLHGMNQRGGSIECSVLIGPSVSSYVGNDADVVVSLEALEGLRALSKMTSHTRVLFNHCLIRPYHLALSQKPYPNIDAILREIRRVTPHVYQIDGSAIVSDLRLPRTLNTVILGALTQLDIPPLNKTDIWKAIEKLSAKRLINDNRLAYKRGLEEQLK